MLLIPNLVTILSTCMYSCGMLVMIMIYSHVAFVLFGHQTYWRPQGLSVDAMDVEHIDNIDSDSQDMHVMTKGSLYYYFDCIIKTYRRWRKQLLKILKLILPKGYIISSNSNKHHNSIGYNNGNIARSTRNSQIDYPGILSTCTGDIFLELIAFLRPADLISLTSTCRRYRDLINSMDQLIWPRYQATIFANYSEYLPALLSHIKRVYGDNNDKTLSHRMELFLSIKAFPLYLAGSISDNDSTNVVVHGKVFAFPPTFVRDHPGGQSILLHYHQRDASVVFDVASHSATAHRMAKQFLRWSSQEVLGRRGTLQAVIRWIQQHCPNEIILEWAKQQKIFSATKTGLLE